MEHRLKVAQVAALVGCHRNTILRYEAKGMISASRDHNGHRVFSLQAVLDLKKRLGFGGEGKGINRTTPLDAEF